MKMLIQGAVALLLLGIAGQAAAQFNTDALKKMQKEGHKIVAESEKNAADAKAADSEAKARTAAAGAGAQAAPTAPGAQKGIDEGRSFRFTESLCLDATGMLSVERCAKDAAGQRWRSDDEGRLVAHTGQCLAPAGLTNCNAGAVQKWALDPQGRLANKAQQCLQVTGQPPKPGSRVIAARCSAAKSQLWF